MHPATFDDPFTTSSAEPGARIGFVAHIAELINHYRAIWKHLPPGSFELVNAGLAEHAAEIEDVARAEGVACVAVADVVARGAAYDVLVSNHPIDFAMPVPLIKRIGRVNVRLMYSVAKSGWNLRAWNQWYDVVLCLGPYHRETLSQVTGAAMVEIGYPRFDHFFGMRGRRDELVTAYGGDPARRTIVWLPTWKDLSSVGWFDDAIAALAPTHNVIVKLHPLMSHTEPAKVAAVRALGLTHVIADSSDNVPLYAAADVIFCDYGGPALGAVYAGKDVLLLDVPGAERDELLGDGSPDLLIRQWMPHVSPAEAASIPALLADRGLWSRQRQVRRELRAVFFAPHVGYSGRVAAQALLHARELAEHASLAGVGG